MTRKQSGYVNRSALIDGEQFMTASNVTASNQDRLPAAQARAKPSEINCQPMAHQISGAHGHEMYPQQFVHLVGCHSVPATALRRLPDEKLH